MHKCTFRNTVAAAVTAGFEKQLKDDPSVVIQRKHPDEKHTRKQSDPIAFVSAILEGHGHLAIHGVGDSASFVATASIRCATG